MPCDVCSDSTVHGIAICPDKDPHVVLRFCQSHYEAQAVGNKKCFQCALDLAWLEGDAFNQRIIGLGAKKDGQASANKGQYFSSGTTSASDPHPHAILDNSDSLVIVSNDMAMTTKDSDSAIALSSGSDGSDLMPDHAPDFWAKQVAYCRSDVALWQEIQKDWVKSSSTDDKAWQRLKSNNGHLRYVSPGKKSVRVTLGWGTGKEVADDVVTYIRKCLDKQPYTMSKKETEKFLTDADPSKKWESDIDNLIPTISNDRIEIVKIDLVINPERWAEYYGYVNDGTNGLQLPVRTDSTETKWSQSGDFPWLASHTGNVISLPIYDLNTGQYYLFHGTSLGGVDGISDVGFDPDRCRHSKTMGIYGSLGQGAYLSDNFAKCAAYARCEHCGCCACTCKICVECGNCVTCQKPCGCNAGVAEPLRPVLLSRVAYKAGRDRVRVTKKYNRRKRSAASLLEKMKTKPATTICEGRPDRGKVAKLFDRQFGNNDFIVYDKRMAYTEFVVWYRRKASGSTYKPEVLQDGKPGLVTSWGQISNGLLRLKCLAQGAPSCGQRAVFNILAMMTASDITNDKDLRELGPLEWDINIDGVRALLEKHEEGKHVVVIQDLNEIPVMLGLQRFPGIDEEPLLKAFVERKTDVLCLVLNTRAQNALSSGSGGHWIAVLIYRIKNSEVTVMYADSLEREHHDRTALMGDLLGSLDLTYPSS